MRLLRIGLALIAVLAFGVFIAASAWPDRDGHRAAAPLATATPAVTATPTPARRTPTTSECTTPGVDRYARIADATAPGGTREVWIHRPSGQDSTRVPVLYLLGDRGTSDRTLARAGLGRLLDREMCRTGIPFVVAVPDGRTISAADPEWSDATDGRFSLERFVTTSLVGLVEGHQRRRAADRAIGGFGMGGFGAMSIALRNPALYTQVASFGGWFQISDPDGVFAGDAASHAPDQLIGNGTARHQRYFLAEGTQDATPLQYGTVQGEADRFAALIRQHGSTVDVRHPVGGHDQRTWDRQLPGLVRFLDHNWTAARD